MAGEWRSRIAQIILGGTGFLSLAAGALFTYKTQYEHPKYRYLPADQEWRDHLRDVVEASRQNLATAAAVPLAVDVSGAVQKPGVYTLASGARVQEAILAAGGFKTDADKEFIHQRLNLADSVRDKGKIYIPFAGESVVTANLELNAPTDSPRTININQANSQELDELPGIGAKRVQNIMANRPFANEADLRERAGLNSSVLSAINDLGITLIY